MTDKNDLAARLKIITDQVDELQTFKQRNAATTQDLEEAEEAFVSDIPKLTTGDDIEDVKRVVNQIIDTLSQS